MKKKIFLNGEERAGIGSVLDIICLEGKGKSCPRLRLARKQSPLDMLGDNLALPSMEYISFTVGT